MMQAAEEIANRTLLPSIIVAATLDTKHAEIAVLAKALEAEGLRALVIDCGVLGDGSHPADISAAEIAALAEHDIGRLRSQRDRGVAIPAMMRGLAIALGILRERRLVRGYLSMGGGTNTSLASAAIDALPFGIPKLVVSTTVSGNTSALVGFKDVVLIHSVIDILGVSRYFRGLADEAAAVMAALVRQAERQEAHADTIVIGVTAFGATTTAADAVFQRLSAKGHDVLTFHARGTGGRAAEAFMRQGRIDAMLDLTTTEIADEIAGGNLSAGRERLDAAAELGLPQVVLPGAIDIVNFGPRETVPARFEGRVFATHTPTATLMRTNAAENAAIGRFVAEKLNRARGPASVLIPARGYSAYDIAGGPFFDPAADRAFVDALRSALQPGIPVEVLDAHINDASVAERAVDTLLTMIAETRRP